MDVDTQKGVGVVSLMFSANEQCSGRLQTCHRLHSLLSVLKDRTRIYLRYNPIYKKVLFTELVGIWLIWLGFWIVWVILLQEWKRPHPYKKVTRCLVHFPWLSQIYRNPSKVFKNRLTGKINWYQIQKNINLVLSIPRLRNFKMRKGSIGTRWLERCPSGKAKAITLIRPVSF